jgi:hypothetical protein
MTNRRSARDPREETVQYLDSRLRCSKGNFSTDPVAVVVFAEPLLQPFQERHDCPNDA